MKSPKKGIFISTKTNEGSLAIGNDDQGNFTASPIAQIAEDATYHVFANQRNINQCDGEKVYQAIRDIADVAIEIETRLITITHEEERHLALKINCNQPITDILPQRFGEDNQFTLCRGANTTIGKFAQIKYLSLPTLTLMSHMQSKLGKHAQTGKE